MKFDPQLTSYIIAINSKSVESDISIIKSFYSKEPITLIGTWKGKKEYSYQIEMSHVDIANMWYYLKQYDQETFILMQNSIVYLHSLQGGVSNIGRMTQLKGRRIDCTYCPMTDTYWKALL